MGRLMNRKHGLLNAILLSMLATFTAAAIAAKGPSLLEMSEQMDGIDKQDFQAAIDKAISCTHVRNFSCAEAELAKAAKAANSGQDKKTLLASRQSLVNEKQQLANEIRRAEEERQAQVRRDEEQKQAAIRREDERQARARRDEREAQEAEERQSSQVASESIGAQIIRMGNENAAILGNIDRQTNAAYAETNRRLAAQAAERDRARAEQNNREAERRRDAERNRADAQRTAQVQDRNDANARNQREADAARVQQERERQQNQARQQEQERQQNLARQQEQVRQKADAAAAKQAAQQAEKLAAEQYLISVAAGTRLVATKCPDGEGKYYATGKRPNIKPEVVGCVDVRYRAYCAGSTQYSEGIARNFIGMAGCFGDTYDINPKPDCKVDQVHIEVVEARACGH